MTLKEMKMPYLIYDAVYGKAYRGETLEILACSVPGCKISAFERCVYILYKKDTVSFSKEYANEELHREAAKRIIHVLTTQYKYCYTLYKMVA